MVPETASPATAWNCQPGAHNVIKLQTWSSVVITLTENWLQHLYGGWTDGMEWRTYRIPGARKPGPLWHEGHSWFQHRKETTFVRTDGSTEGHTNCWVAGQTGPLKLIHEGHSRFQPWKKAMSIHLPSRSSVATCFSSTMLFFLPPLIFPFRQGGGFTWFH